MPEGSRKILIHRSCNQWGSDFKLLPKASEQNRGCQIPALSSELKENGTNWREMTKRKVICDSQRTDLLEIEKTPSHPERAWEKRRGILLLSLRSVRFNYQTIFLSKLFAVFVKFMLDNHTTDAQQIQTYIVLGTIRKPREGKPKEMHTYHSSEKFCYSFLCVLNNKF